MAAVLRSLRSYVVSHSGEAPEIVDDEKVVLGDNVSYPVSEATGYSSYPLGSVVLLLREKKASSYIAECAARGWPTVAQSERQDLLEFLTGAKESLPELKESGRREEETQAANEEEESGALDDGVPLFNTYASMMCPGLDLTFALDLIDKEFEKPQHKRKSESKSTTTKESAASQPDKVPSKTPEKQSAEPEKREPRIIVVPSGMTSLLTILNAPDFLQDGRFVTTEAKRAAGAKKEPAVIIERRTGNTEPVKFRVIDNPTRLNDREWNRVVAVFALGKQWQFSSWKHSEAVKLFQRTLGVYLKYDDEETPDTIKKWNVHVLSISKEKRHLDQPVMFEFWRLLEEFMKNRVVKRRPPSNGGKPSSSSSSRHHRPSHEKDKKHQHRSSSGRDKRKPSSTDKNHNKKPRPS